MAVEIDAGKNTRPNGLGLGSAPIGVKPSQGSGIDSRLLEILTRRFGFNAFRPHQLEVCRDVAMGHDALLVMPTGAGKSLCYQVPGISLGARCLVIGPLIALMDDQVGQLREKGLRAAAIHSGKSREESREICISYAKGQLEFLFIAPERLGVPGFLEFLAKYKPSLVVIDEAHCISQWGHDFRFDYRRLSERLPALRPAPVLALTATATSMVQEDIIEQLGLSRPKKHIKGFRRTNIAIEVGEVSKPQRKEAALSILKDKDRLPCVIYAPTRSEAEATAKFLSDSHRVSAYHAGMDAEHRAKIQDDFLSGRSDVIVATVAFGMGIDKANVRTVIHMAVPGSVEGYYQEIGRAGRDGAYSKAFLFHSFADVKTHEYFQNRNYPEVSELKDILSRIPKKGIERDAISSPLEKDMLDHCLERLKILGAIEEETSPSSPIGIGGGLVRKITARGWENPYREQKKHRKEQLGEMLRYLRQGSTCRMLMLMAHFGDADAVGGKTCGICDVCKPETSVLAQARSLSQSEIKICQAIMNAVILSKKQMTTGKLYRDHIKANDELKASWSVFASCLEALEVSKALEVHDRSFQKDGKTVDYKVVIALKRPSSITWSKIETRSKAYKAPAKSKAVRKRR